MSGNAKNDKRVKNGGRTVFAEESMGEWKGITATQKKYKNKRVGAKWWKDSVLQSCHSILAKYFIKQVGQMGR